MLPFLFFSCADSTLESLDQDLSLNSRASLDIVSTPLIQDSYLRVENYESLDSIFNMLDNMTRDERIAWESQEGFQSAESFYNPYLEAFDEIETQEAFEKYRKQNESILSITLGESGIEVDYPFDAGGFLPVVSSSGKLAIGNEMFIYKRDRKITIVDYTSEKLAQYENALTGNSDQGVYVDYNGGYMLFSQKGPDALCTTLKSFPANGSFYEQGKRKFRASLDHYTVWYSENSQWKIKNCVALYIKAMKKNSWLGGWRTYNATYHVTDIKYKLNNGTLNTPWATSANTSKDNKGGRYYNLFESDFYYIQKNSSSTNRPHTYKPSGFIIDLNVYHGGQTTKQNIKHESYSTDPSVRLHPAFSW